MPDNPLSFQLEGKTTTIDDFTLGELEWLEDECGASLDKVDFSSMKVAVRIVYLLKKREDPDFTLDQARELKLSIFDEEEVEEKKRPTRAGKKAGAGPQT